MEFPAIDMSSRFYLNCKRQRDREARICQECPFRKGIELQEFCDFVIGAIKAEAQREAKEE